MHHISSGGAAPLVRGWNGYIPTRYRGTGTPHGSSLEYEFRQTHPIERQALRHCFNEKITADVNLTRRKPSTNLLDSPAAGSRDLAAANACVGRLAIASNFAHISAFKRDHFSKPDVAIPSARIALDHGSSIVPNTIVKLKKPQIFCLYLSSTSYSIDGTPPRLTFMPSQSHS